MRGEILKKFVYPDIKPIGKKGVNVSSYFGENVFNLRQMEKYVSRKTLLAFKAWIHDGKKINKECANEIAEAMKDWSLSRGATHYTHWFLPLTGLTAEKHDGFIKLNMPGQVIEEFSGSKLISGEPDASSFPSGGIRSTFEARGYTAWDPSSPAFIMESATSNTLCIPSIFISYTGEALDKKLPLLRSEESLNKSAVNFLKIFGKTTKKVYSTCGAEQEYFLIDRNYYYLRQDLLLTNRTLLGAPSPKGQQLEDQYFGSIKERVMNFMNAVEEEAYKYGIPLCTRHNEVAPNQYEFAPIFEESNIAADHNQLLMEIMKRIAQRFGLVCLLHEKPFAGVNGSGKHVNWSMCDAEGNNLLSAGETREDTIQFLTVLTAILRGVYKYSDLLYASVVSAGNEHRLGANEAPPAIISVFLGQYLSDLLDKIEEGKKTIADKKDIVDFEIGRLPQFVRDTTDRNRTSPFAFTGSKFEFRAVGSSQNIATPVTVINTIIADSLDFISDEIKKKMKSEKKFEDAVLSVLREVLKETKPIRFEGNNYSQEWREEAEKRGLGNEPSAARALKAFIKKKNVDLFEKYKVFSKSEAASRYHIWVEMYCTLLDIEASTLMEMANANVIPSALKYQNLLLQNVQIMDSLKNKEKFETAAETDLSAHLKDVTNKIYYTRRNIKELEKLVEGLKTLDVEKKAEKIFSVMKPLCIHLRKHIDEIEQIVPDDCWPLPKYREMLFLI